MEPLNHKILNEMEESLLEGKALYRPSKYWEMLNAENLFQLKKFGIANFKQYQALNYFTFFKTLTKEDFDQFKFLVKNSSLKTVLRCLTSSYNLSGQFGGKVPLITKIFYQFFVKLLWEYALDNDKKGVLTNIDEPKIGNPFPVYRKRRLISQDLANSTLEYYAVTSASAIKKNDELTCAELGAGYGRNAYLFLKVHPNIRYILIDIPPALLIAQEYLSRVFPPKKIFRFRRFSNFNQVEDEFNKSQIVFLTPPQLELLPRKSIGLFLTISTLHEMRMDQIKNYFMIIDRLTSGVFYIKQWKSGYVVMENIYIKEEDYPIPKNWKLVFQRQPKVQTKFFEKAFLID